MRRGEPPQREGGSTHLTVKIEGIVLPPWAGMALLLMTVLSVTALLFVWIYCRELGREIRVLQLHVQDVESAMIESGQAQREDFAEWGSAPLRTRPPAREKEE